jgi:aspartate 1-decarboxylase
MFRTMLKSRIHPATVTDDDPHSAGSVLVDADLMDAADLLEGEQVTVVEVTNGAWFQTYAVKGARGSGVFSMSGAAAPIRPGDVVTLLSFGVVKEADARSQRPRVVFVDARNRIVDTDRAMADDGLLTGLAAAESVDGTAETDDAARLDALLQQQET